MYQTEHDELFASIRSGTPVNDGVQMSESTLMAIMGRMAAYTGAAVTWEQALNSKESLLPPESWGDRPIPAMAVPGTTRLI
jgi:myo-inositol 2-dehydrogenase/D-chiro-inositol 1-dehydrogenase